MEGVHIRRAGIKDAHIISYLGKKTFTETFSDIFSAEELSDYLDKTFNENKLQTSVLKDENIFGILYYLDNPVGYYKIKIGMDYNHSADSKSAQLQKIYVLSDYLHLKLGKDMLKDIISLEEIKDCKTMWLVVLHANLRAIKFYEHQGFEKLRKYHHQIGSHLLEYELMVKPLFIDPLL